MSEMYEYMRNFVGQKGQTIVEAIVVIGIVVLLVTGLIAGTTISMKTARSGQTKSQAINLADQGVEIVRAIRDSNWTVFAALNGQYCLGTSGQLTPPPCAADIVTEGAAFTRSVQFVLQGETMIVTVSVNTADGSLIQPIVLTTYFTQWK